MAPLRRVPWYSSLEWMDVYNGVFSNELMKRDAAISRIGLWEIKSNRVPVAVSLTRLILKALNADQEGTRSTIELQMLYGAAIIRFVNSYVDLEQHKVYAQSIGTVAREIGIPSEVVDCRHRLTHQDMPTLQLLRHTISICFDYLQAKYWEPQAELVRSRLASMSQSKYLASGLVALLQDLENLSPPDDLEAGLQKLVDEVATPYHIGQQLSSSSIASNRVSVHTLLFAAADVAGLKQKDTMRALRRMGMPEYFSQPAFVATSAWCQQIRKTLPKCMEFLETILYQCPHENVTLSFLKDLVLVAYDADFNPAAALAVIWILGRASPNLAYRLVTRIVNSLTSDSSQSTFPSTSLPMASATSCCDYKCFSPSTDNAMSDSCLDNSLSNNTSMHYNVSMEHPSGEHSSVTSPSSSTLGDDGVGLYCYDPESFSLWLRSMDVPPDEEEQLANDLSNFGYQSRLINWLRTLLLLPPFMSQNTSSNGHEPSHLPFCLQLLLHLFCDPPTYGSSTPSAKLAMSATSSSNQSSLAGLASTTRDLFCQRLLQCVNTVHGRVLAACRANIDTVAHTAFRLLFVESSVQSPQQKPLTDSTLTCTQKGLKLLLRLFEEADVRVPDGATGRLVEWISSRVLRRPDGSTESTGRLQRQTLQRLLLPLGRSNSASPSYSFLTDQFKAVLINLLQNSSKNLSEDRSVATGMQSDGGVGESSTSTDLDFYLPQVLDSNELFSSSRATAVHMGLNEIRRTATTATEVPAVHELSTLAIPWTHPGTYPIQTSFQTLVSSCVDAKPIIELLPLSGNQLIAPVADVLRSFTSAPLQSPVHRLGGLKRTFRSVDRGDSYNDYEDAELGLSKRPAKRLRNSDSSGISATDRFLFNLEGCSMREDLSLRATKFCPNALHQLETEIIKSQQSQFPQKQPNNDSNETVWTMPTTQCDGDRLMHDWCTVEDMLDNPHSNRQDGR